MQARPSAGNANFPPALLIRTCRTPTWKQHVLAGDHQHSDTPLDGPQLSCYRCMHTVQRERRALSSDVLCRSAAGKHSSAAACCGWGDSSGWHAHK